MKASFAQSVVFAVRVLAAALACVGVAAASPPQIDGGEALADAQDLYSQGKWSAAYGRFARLADEGNADAAKIALLMLRYGPKLYGHEWGASQSQIDHWIELNLQRITVSRVNADE